MFVSMADFVRENAVEFMVTLPGTRNTYVNGRLQKGPDAEPVLLSGIVLALTEDDRTRADNGNYTEYDRKIYTTKPLVKGAVVDYLGETYTIDRELPHATYTDVYMYYAKGKGPGNS